MLNQRVNLQQRNVTITCANLQQRNVTITCANLQQRDVTITCARTTTTYQVASDAKVEGLLDVVPRHGQHVQPDDVIAHVPHVWTSVALSDGICNKHRWGADVN